MSRSRKKNPFCGISLAKSEKSDKQIANRKNRRINKEILKTFDDSKLLSIFETSDKWIMAKDGKQMINPLKNPECIRK